MRKLERKLYLAQKRRARIRSKVRGTEERPRLVLTLSNQHAYAQCINDETGFTQVALSSLTKDLRAQHLKPNKAGMEVLGKQFGALLKEKKIQKVVFDRAGKLYKGGKTYKKEEKNKKRHEGRVEVFADAVRAQGINF